MTASTLLGTYKTPLYADRDGRPRVGTLRIPLDLAGHGMVAGEYRIRVEPLTPEIVFHADGHGGCPQTLFVDVRTEDRTLVGQLACCESCAP